MADYGQLLLGLAAGGAFGIAIGWLAARSRTPAQPAGLLEELRLQLSARETELTSLRQEFAATVAQRAAAEEKAGQVGELKETLRSRDEEINRFQAELADLKAGRASLETSLENERQAMQEKLALLNDAQARLADAFKALSAEALQSNNQSFLELARTKLAEFQAMAQGDLEKRQQAIEQALRPVKESLTSFDLKLADLEKHRLGAYEGLTTQVRSLIDLQNHLRTETGNLVKALGTPRIRGRWGEIQLRRVVELAGMLDHCDFEEQQSVSTEDGRLRPDLLIRLPGGKNIVVDAKAPLAALLDALDVTDDAARNAKLQEHARHIRDHMAALSRKSYWDQFRPAPEFVVLFLPGEHFFSAALEQDPSLIEQGVEQRVILATPTTLIALLKAVAYGWRQEKLAANARQISDLGKELYKRVLDMAGHFSDVGGRLQKAIESYNRAVGSLETRVLVSARRFKELEATGTEPEIPPALPIETQPRDLQASLLCREPSQPDASETPPSPHLPNLST